MDAFDPGSPFGHHAVLALRHDLVVEFAASALPRSNRALETRHPEERARTAWLKTAPALVQSPVDAALYLLAHHVVPPGEGARTRRAIVRFWVTNTAPTLQQASTSADRKRLDAALVALLARAPWRAWWADVGPDSRERSPRVARKSEVAR